MGPGHSEQYTEVGEDRDQGEQEKNGWGGGGQTDRSWRDGWTERPGASSFPRVPSISENFPVPLFNIGLSILFKYNVPSDIKKHS